MYKRASFNTYARARRLRKRGLSYESIATKLNISKSTAHFWTRHICLSELQIRRLRKNSQRGSQKGLKTIAERKKNVKKDIRIGVNNLFKKITFNTNFYKLICALLYWAEGAKRNTSGVVFVNSDPIIVRTYLCLFRSCFKLEESKFRILVHIHDYHDDKSVKKFWSETTNIPVSQFNKSYLKKNTKKRSREGFMGTASIRYYDYKIALELQFIYNTFALLKGRRSTADLETPNL